MVAGRRPVDHHGPGEEDDLGRVRAVWMAGALVACAGSQPPEGPRLAVGPATVPNLLARTVTLELPRPASATLACTSEAGVGLDVVLPTAADVHRHVLTGLHPGSWTCIATTDGAQRSVSFPVEEVGFLTPTVVGDPAEGVWVALASRETSEDVALMVFDPRGRARFFAWLPPVSGSPSPGVFTEPWEDTIVAGGGRALDAAAYDGRGVVVWAAGGAAGRPHHDAEIHDDALVALTFLQQGGGDERVEGFGIEELGWDDGEPTWTWSSFDHLEALSGPDPWHANAVRRVTDGLGEAFWVSAREQDALLRIDRQTGNRTHLLGKLTDFTLYDTDGQPTDDWFLQQHDPHFDGDTVLLLDNGSLRDERRYSRVLELSVDLDAHTATVQRQWTEPDWFSLVMGGVERLDDGDWLVSQGHCADWCDALPGATGEVARVEPDSGEVKWRLVLHHELYRARRIDGCAFLPATCGARR